MQGNIVEKFKLKNGREIVFRYPKMGDAPLMLDYINTLSKERTFIRFQGEQLTFEEEEKHLSDLLKKTENKEAVSVLVFCGPQLIGSAGITMRDKCEKHIGGFGILMAKEYRNLGIGKKLMQTVLDEAVKKISQLKIIVLSCFSDNSVALKMYESFGFKKFGTLPEGIMHKEHFDDHIYMYKYV